MVSPLLPELRFPAEVLWGRDFELKNTELTPLRCCRIRMLQCLVPTKLIVQAKCHASAETFTGTSQAAFEIEQAVCVLLSETSFERPDYGYLRYFPARVRIPVRLTF